MQAGATHSPTTAAARAVIPGPIIVFQLDEAGISHEPSPAGEVVIDAVAPAIPAFLIGTTRVGAEQHTTRLQRRMQLPQHAQQLLRWHMKQRGICEHAIEPRIRKIEFEKILLPNFASRIGARHLNKPLGTFKSNRFVA